VGVEGGLNLCPSQWNWKDERRVRAPTRGVLESNMNLIFEIVLAVVIHSL